jgi:hypothetical protein
MLARTLNDFHHWLPASKLVFAPSIILDPVQGLPSSLASGVARHLNEFDDGAEGRWIAFAPELIEAIARDSAQLSLLGLDDERGRMFSADPNSIRRRVLKALARRGHAVLDGPLAADAGRSLETVFRAGLGRPPKDIGELHLLLNPDRFSECCLPSLIGDTYLEWQAAWQRADAV